MGADLSSLTGLHWLHADGPDGRVVLLAYLSPRTGDVNLIDDNRWCVPDWPRVHKWTVYHAEPVIRPEPAEVPDAR